VWTRALLTGVRASKGTDFNLTGVACPSTSDCLVVGTAYDNIHGTSQPVVEKFDGRSWTRVSVGQSSDTWQDVACFARDDCMIVGYSGSDQPVTETYRDGRWSRSTPSTAHVELTAVACSTSNTCIVAGTPFAALSTFKSWIETNGKWSAVPVRESVSAETFVNSISCVNRGYCEGVGSYGYGGPAGAGISFHFNGSSWTTDERQDATVYRGGFGNVSCTARSTCVATEDLSWPYSSDPDGRSGFFAQELLKGHWHNLGRQLPVSMQLYVAEGGVQCFATGSCYVVGGSDTAMYFGVVDHATLEPLAVVSGVRLGDPAPYPWLASLSCPTMNMCVEVGSNPGSPYVLVGRVKP